MNVDSTSFNRLLPTILKHISNSHFIAFDLELSGIPTQRRRDAGSSKQTLQHRYQELKRAAQKFHILQVGLTCVEEDLQNNKYLIRAYNFNISPLVGYGVDLEREFTYSTGAVDFLLSHGYQMEAPFYLGVPYLTRSETRYAEERARLQWDKSAIPDIKIDSSDLEALNFMQRVRDDIDAWLMSSKPEKVQCIVGGSPSPTAKDPNAAAPPNRFQRRLVHQLVRAEYPKLSTSAKGDYVHVYLKNIPEEAKLKDSFERRLADSMFNQIGFRWIADALSGYSLSDISPHLCGPQISGEPDTPNSKQFARRLDELANAVQSRKKVLVGHNCFLDLIYFYQTFIGDLPETVVEFQGAIREIFDLVVDTKYMATAGPGGEAFRSSQLWQVDDALSNLRVPILETPSEHPSYDESEQYHEAGYDSFATAKVFLRLAAQLGANKSDVDALGTLAVEESDSKATASQMETAGRCASNVNPLSAVSEAEQARERKKKISENFKPSSKPKPSPKNKFSSANVFDKLADVSDDHRIPVSAENPASSSSAVGPAAAGDGVLPEPIAAGSPPRPPGDQQPPSKPIPSWDAEMWNIYGNKLRVYGTVEEMCDLSGKRAASGFESETGAPSAENPPVRRPSMLAGFLEKFKGIVI